MSIIHYVSLHVESARTALKQLLRQPVGTLLTLLMLAVAMTLPLFMYLGIQSGQSVLGKLNESPQITLYMETDASKADSDAVRNLLERDARLNKIRFISKQEGLEELQSNLDQNLVSMLDGNPLPDAFIVTPDPATPPAQMQAIYQDMVKLPMVESATMDTEWVQTLYQINEFIRRPFLYQAMWQSIFSAAVSLGLCGWLLSAVRPLVDAIFKPYGLNIGWRFFHFSEVSLVFGFVIALGVFGAWLATTQHLLGFRAKK